MNFRQPFATGLDCDSINVNQQNFLDIIPLERVACRSPISPASDQDSTWLPMHDERSMDQRFMIEKFITCAGLPATIQHQRLTISTTFNDHQFLKGGLALNEHLVDPVLPGVIRGENFTNPFLCRLHPFGLSVAFPLLLVGKHGKWVRCLSKYCDGNQVFSDQSQSLIRSRSWGGIFFMTARSI